MMGQPYSFLSSLQSYSIYRSMRKTWHEISLSSQVFSCKVYRRKKLLFDSIQDPKKYDNTILGSFAFITLPPKNLAAVFWLFRVCPLWDILYNVAFKIFLLFIAIPPPLFFQMSSISFENCTLGCFNYVWMWSIWDVLFTSAFNLPSELWICAESPIFYFLWHS